MGRKISKKQTNPRWQSLAIVQSVAIDGMSLDDALLKLKSSSVLVDHRDYALCAEIAHGTIRRYFGLKGYLKELLDSPIRKKDADIELILMLGIYQLFYLRSNQYAVVNETVELAKLQNKHWARGLVNAILRKVIRSETSGETISDQSCYPDWLVAQVKIDWPDDVENVLAEGNRRAPMTLRLDTRRVHRAEFCDNSDHQCEPSALVETAVLLDAPVDVHELSGFDSGLVSVQDGAAQIAATLLDLKPRQLVLDACAAPGGKTLHIVQSEPDIQLQALDVSEKRLENVSQNLERANVQATLICGDASLSESWSKNTTYDRILADVPCSGSGVIRRHPDIRLLRRQSDIKALMKRQAKILDSLWAVLKPGGVLVYSTCSIFRCENENQIVEFLSRWEDSVELPLDSVQWGRQQVAGRQILPGEDGMDGFYYARLQKKAASDS